MKHFFVVNPKAGKGNADQGLVEKIFEAGAALNIDVAVHTTKKIYDGYYYTRDFLNTLPEGSTYRIYSCGGDGTLNEVMNAMFEFRDTHKLYLGCVPTGTGNDFVRNFQNIDFTNIKAQMLGVPEKVDLIAFKYNDGK